MRSAPIKELSRSWSAGFVPRACHILQTISMHRVRCISAQSKHGASFPSQNLARCGHPIILEPHRPAGPRPQPPLPAPTQALNIFLPLVFLLCSILRPLLVRIRLRNPCLRMRISRDGRFMFMYRRGPQRICEPTPESAGCDVTAVLGTTSAVAAAASAAAAAVVAVGVKALGMRSPAAGLLAKMLGGADTPGRRIGRDENDLDGWSFRQSEVPRWIGAGGCRANLDMAGCLATSRTAARSADWAKSRDIFTVLQWVRRVGELLLELWLSSRNAAQTRPESF